MSKDRAENFPLSVQAAASHLHALRELQLGIILGLAGSIIRVPRFEGKTALAHFLYSNAEFASVLRKRLTELRITSSDIDSTSDFRVRVASAIMGAASSVELSDTITSLYMQYKTIMSRYINHTDPILDRPSVLLLNRFRGEIDETCAKITKSLGEHVEVYSTLSDGSCRVALERDFQDIHISGLAFGAPQTERLPERVKDWSRDSRFTTFQHTRQYDSMRQDHWPEIDTYEYRRLELTWVQRDEIDAIETFSNVLYDTRAEPFELALYLARLVEDEARHAEAGQRALSDLGENPFDLPCSTIGIAVRSHMAPIEALAQINIFGELSIVGPLRALSREAYDLGDDPTGRMFDFVHADEMHHLRGGRDWLRQLTGHSDLNVVEEAARISAAARLVDLGVIGEDYASRVTRADLSRLIGE